MKKLNEPTRLLIYTIICVIIIVFFSDSLLLFYNGSIFERFFAAIVSSATNDVLLSFSLLSVFLLVLKKILRGYRFSFINHLIIIIFSILYLIIRIQSDTRFLLTSFFFFDKLKYLDWILLFGCEFSISFIITRIDLNKDQANNSILFIDEPISSIDEDKLNRKYIANDIVDQIIKLNVDRSFAIGIIGEWGDGKSSFLNLMKPHLKQNSNIIIIDFNPWLSSNPDNIIEDYFLTLHSELKIYTNEIRYTLEEYASKLKVSESNNVVGTFKELLLQKTSSEIKYQLIRNILIRLRKKMVVFIDDIDRLSKQEVIEVIKIIRNSGSFYNTVFVVAYDRNYINEAIKSITEHKPDQYIDKIFQTEYSLPPVSVEYIEEYIESSLSSKFPKSVEEIKEGLRLLQNLHSSNLDMLLPFGVKEKSYINYLANNISNHRDALRYVNSICLFYDSIVGEISLVELMLLHLIKLTSYSVYNNLQNRYFIKEVSKEGSSVLQLEKDIINKYLEKFENKNKESIFGILEMLFQETKDFPRSIIFPYNFDLYFDNRIYGKVSLVTFNTLRKENDYLKLLIQVKSWIKEGFADEFVRLFSNIDLFFNKTDFENFIKLYFYLMETTDIIIFDKLLSLLDKSLKEKEYQKIYMDNDFQSLENIVYESIINSKETRNIEEFLHKLHQNYNYIDGFEFIISYEKFKNSCLERLYLHLNSIEHIEENSYSYLYRCIESISPKTNKVRLIDAALRRFKEKIIDNPNEYLKHIIVPLYIPHDGYTYSLEGFTEQIFGSYLGFEEFLNAENIDQEYKSVITDFYELYKAAGYKGIHVNDEDLLNRITKLRENK